MISNLTHVARLFDFQTTPVILHQVKPQLLNSLSEVWKSKSLFMSTEIYLYLYFYNLLRLLTNLVYI